MPRRRGLACLGASVVACLAVVSVTAAHKGEILSITIDDARLREAVIRTACDHLRHVGIPQYCRASLSFDYDRGRIAAKFTRSGRTAIVRLFFSEFGVARQVSVFGFRRPNDEPRDTSGAIDVRATAEGVLARLPPDIRSELSLSHVQRVRDQYIATWLRTVRGIPVLGETLVVTIGAHSGRVLEWDLDVFDFPASALPTVARVTIDEAVARANEAFARMPVPMQTGEFPPRLAYRGRRLYWAVRGTNGIPDTQFFRFFVLVDARDGEVTLEGDIRVLSGP